MSTPDLGHRTLTSGINAWPPLPESALFQGDLDILGVLPAASPADTPPVPFSDDSWRLNTVETWPAYKRRTDLVWAGIENPAFRVTAKEAALCLMQPQIALDHRLPAARRKPYPPWALPHQRISYWRRWFNFIGDRGHTSLATVTQETCNAFLQTITPQSRHIAIGAIRVFADYRLLLTHGGFLESFRPWGDASAMTASGEAGLGEPNNKTPAIPDGVFAPLLAGALYLVETIGPQLIAANKELERLQALQTNRRGNPNVDIDARLDDYLMRLRTEGRSLPMPERAHLTTSPLALPIIALNIGLVDGHHLKKSERWAKLLAAADELGVGPGGLLVDGSSLDFTPTSLRSLGRVVHIACYVVVAGLSGMRSSELAEVDRHAYRREVLDGGVVRHRLQSMLIKGEPPGGRRETWTVIEQVVNALKTAEALVPAEHPLEMHSFQRSLAELITWVNTAGEVHNLQPIPTDWQLTPRQFRRTLARELAWRPSGVIAGKIHLKHVSVATTEGYAGARGESANAFLAEVEAERRQSNEQTARRVLAAIEQGEPVAGLGARELTAAVAALPDASSDGPQIRERDDALLALVRARAGVLQPTPLAHCWFVDPARARCLRNVADKSRPIVGSCQPTLCANATIHREHAPAWVSGIDALRATLTDRRVPAGERQRLDARLSDMEGAVRPLLEGTE